MDKELRHLLSAAILVLLMTCMPVAAQTKRVKPSAATRVSLITILPGRSLYSAFGHSAIRVLEPDTGSDVLYNYGLSARPFDFRFALGMLVGQMEFMVAVLDTKTAFRFYSEEENRTIIEQELQLDGDTTSALIIRLERDIRPENRVYRYRYFTDNCATRIWELLAPLLIRGSLDSKVPHTSSLRDTIHEALKGNPWLGAGLDIALGPVTDRPHLGEAPIFLPQQLMQAAAMATTENGEEKRNFVTSTILLYKSTRATGQELRLESIAAGIAILLTSSAFLLTALRRGVLAFDSVFFAGIAVVGLFIFMFWVVAGYPEAGLNLNLLWANPLPLITILRRISKQPAKTSARILFIVAGANCILAVSGGWEIQTVPLEARLISASVALRCLHRARLLKHVKIDLTM